MNRKSSSNRKCLLLPFFIMMMHILASQTPLNEVSDLNFHQQNAYSIIEVEDRVIVAGQALVKDEETLEREVFFAEFNSDLEVLSHVVLEDDDDFSSGANNGRELLFYNGSLFRTFHEVAQSGDYSYIVRYSLEDKEIKVIHKVRDTINNLERVWSSALIFDNQNQIVLSLLNSTFQANLTMWIQVLNPDTGELIRQRIFEEPGLDLFLREIVDNSKGYLILGHYYDENNDRTTFIWQLDYELNVLRKVNLEDRNYSHIYLEAVMDGDDIVFTNNEHLGNTSNWRSVLIKMDSDLEVIWEAIVGTSNYSREISYYTGIVNSNDGDGYILCGVNEEESDTIKTPRGQIAKISTEGDSVWHRLLSPLINASGELFDIKASADGNYLATGRARNLGTASIDSIFTKIWLIKFNEQGHIVNKDTTNAATSLHDNKLRIFPIPTTDIIYLEHDDITGLHYELYDERGQLLFTRSDTEAYHTYVLSLSPYSPGIYFLHIVHPDGRWHVERLVLVK